MRPDELLDAALQLPENERIALAARLLESVPPDETGLSIDDPNLAHELDRRFNDPGEGVPASELWDHQE
ncbi:MAG: hypothetical protein HYS13_22830 [Planctomycetia bacterium]|nr:hypothetical protein [Planctomycetia bacterium]